MTEIDDLLVRDAAQWRAELPASRDLDELARRVAGRTSRPAHHRSGWLAAAAVLAVLMCIGLAVLIRTDGPGHLAAPGSIVVAGHRIPYAGPVPWANAVADPADPRVVYVWADGERVEANDVCHVTDYRAVVRGSADRVSIAIAGYTSSAYRGSACDSARWPPKRVAVHLTGPLAHRALVDATTGTTHRVLDPSTIPSIGKLPPGCGTPQLGWDEKTGVAMRSFSPRLTISCAITMVYGPTRAVEAAYPLNGSPSAPVEVRGAPASITTMDDRPAAIMTSLQWSPRPGRLIQLTVNVNPQHPITETEVVAVARSIR